LRFFGFEKVCRQVVTCQHRFDFAQQRFITGACFFEVRSSILGVLFKRRVIQAFDLLPSFGQDAVS